MGTKLLFLLAFLVSGSELKIENSHYCFVYPPVKTLLRPDVLKNISECTHLVFGRFQIDTEHILHVLELEPIYDMENIRIILGQKSQHPNVKFLLGVERTKPFLIYNEEYIARAIKHNFLMKKFDGIFVSFNGPHLENQSSLYFFDGLASQKRFWITLNSTAREVFTLKDPKFLQEINKKVDHVYLDMGETPINWVFGQNSAQIGASIEAPPPAELSTIPAEPAKPTNCTRLCYLDPDSIHESFPIEHLKTDYCSHIVVPYFDVDTIKVLSVKQGNAVPLVKKIEAWRAKFGEAAPKLILSLGSHQETDDWHFVLYKETRRVELAERLVKALSNTTADGIEFAWTHYWISGGAVYEHLKVLIDEVKNKAAKKLEIVVTTSVWNSYKDFYDYEHLNRTADLIVLHSHRFLIHDFPTTRHLSPLRSAHTTDETYVKCSWESLFNHWVSKNVTRSKLVLSLTASTLSFTPSVSMDELEKNPLGQRTSVASGGRYWSQIEICELLKSGNATSFWIPEAEVPYLRHKKEMITYENARSVQIKAVWASTQGAGGVALHNIQLDDLNADCDHKTHFPLLKALSEVQTCPNSPLLRALPSAQTDGNSATDSEKSAENGTSIDKNHVPISTKPAKCTRLCYLYPDTILLNFPLHKLKANDCSHIVVPYFVSDKEQGIAVRLEAERWVKGINEWRAKFGEAPPKLILSLGSKRKEPYDGFYSHTDVEVAEKLVRSIINTTADGLEIAWVNDLWLPRDENRLKTFIDELVKARAEKKFEIIVAVTAKTSYLGFYDFEHLNRTADLIVLHSHRFFLDSYQETRHSSPLRAVPGMRQPRMTWEHLFNQWISKNVTKSKLVLSLTASAFTFIPLTNMETIEKEPLGQSALVITPRSVPYHFCGQRDVCSLLNSGNAVEAWIPEAEGPYLRHKREMITYENARSIQIKAVWASMQGAGGVALHHIELDDPFEFCDHKTPFPLLKALSEAQTCQNSPVLRSLSSAQTDGNSASHLEKSAQNGASTEENPVPIPSKPSNCTRLCYFDPEQIKWYFPFHKLNADDCSHIVVPYFNLDTVQGIAVPRNAESLVQKIDEWRAKFREFAPKLILSLGSNQKRRDWRSIFNNNASMEIAEKLISFISNSTASGLEISWTKDLMLPDDKKLLRTFIDDVVTAKADKKFEIIVAVTAESSYNNLYDYEHLNRIADRIVLHSHHFFREFFQYTSHASPLRATPDMKEPRMTWEHLFNYWVSKNVTKSKLVLSLTASALSFRPFAIPVMLEKEPLGHLGVEVHRNVYQPPIGQRDVCLYMDSGNSVEVWIPEAEVPYLREHKKVTTYENHRSAQIKAIWASTQGAGGLALHDIELDDPFAFCDYKTHFPILRALSSAQFCKEHQETTVSSKTEKKIPHKLNF